MMRMRHARRRWLALVTVAFVGTSAAAAQERRVEIGGTLGWTSSDGVHGATRGASGLLATSITLEDGLSYGLYAACFVNENVQLGLQASHQDSELHLKGDLPVDFGTLGVDNYHVVSVTLLGDDDLRARPYFLFGLGVTRFSRVAFTGLDGIPRAFPARMRFSPTVGTGAKFYLRSRKYGLNLGVRWTPTFLKADSSGFWCDPYWGCFLADNSQFIHQLELLGGLQVRF